MTSGPILMHPENLKVETLDATAMASNPFVEMGLMGPPLNCCLSFFFWGAGAAKRAGRVGAHSFAVRASPPPLRGTTRRASALREGRSPMACSFPVGGRGLRSRGHEIAVCRSGGMNHLPFPLIQVDLAYE